VTARASLVLGTAQFGLAYGLTNTRGRLSDEEVRQILEEARDGGVHTVDTARAYGDAVTRLGKWFAQIGGHWRVITKLTTDDLDDIELGTLLDRERRETGASRLDVLLHRPTDLSGFSGRRLVEGLRQARTDQVVGSIGVSVYTVDDLTKSLSYMPDLDLVQIPGSVVDRRLVDSALVMELHSRGVEIHVRSVLLQGVLMIPTEQLSARFGSLKPILTDIDRHATREGVTRLAVLINEMRSHPAVSAVIVGAASAQEWRATLEAASQSPVRFDGEYELDVDVLDPRRWVEPE
jgi:aryl-alcohol dehydrogenase-like predicted oxidoreductase